MDTKEVKIQVPDGYEIDKENSTFELIKFKPIKKYITYNDVGNKLFKNFQGYLISGYGQIEDFFYESDKFEPNSATNIKQLDRLLALNQLHNIVVYYNSLSAFEGETFQITYSNYLGKYYVQSSSSVCSYGFTPLFNNEKDAEAVIDNPNFREILDKVYKNC